MPDLEPLPTQGVNVGTQNGSLLLVFFGETETVMTQSGATRSQDLIASTVVDRLLSLCKQDNVLLAFNRVP